MTVIHKVRVPIIMRIILVIVLMAMSFSAMDHIVEAKIISVSAGSLHVLALDDNGTVLAWGNNEYGQVGIETSKVPVSTPQKVSIDNVTAIAAGGFDSYALRNDGTVWAWGYNGDGRLGNGKYESTSTPVKVSGLTGVVSIAASAEDCYALKSDGTVWAWGDNRDGELGDGTINATNIPVQVSGLSDIASLGERGTYAVKKDGTIWAWGSNNYAGEENYKGALGDSSQPDIVTTPFKVNGVSNVIMITNGELQTIYVKNDGTMWAWGSNAVGGLGDGSPMGTESDTNNLVIEKPSVQTKISGAISVSTFFEHVVALKKDGTVWEWGIFIDRKGTKDNGGLPPTDKPGISTPAEVAGLDHIVDVSVGQNFCIALKDDGSVWGWGTNHYNELGDHLTVEPSPVLIINKISQATPTVSVQPSGPNVSVSTGSPTSCPQNSPIVPTPESGDPNVSVSTGSPTSCPQNSPIVPTPGMNVQTTVLAVVIIVGSNFFAIRSRRN